MSIKAYKTREDKTQWEVYVAIRSKVDPKIRVQKRERCIESKSKAERREKEIYEQLLRDVLRKEGLAPHWGEVIKRWELHCRSLGNVQEDSIDDYTSSLLIWTRPILGKVVSELTRQDIRSIIQTLQDEGKSASYQTSILNRIKRVWSWGKEEGLIKGGVDNLTLGLKVSKIEEKVPDILTIEEIRKLLQEAKLRNNKWYPIWAAAVYTGMRSGELYALTWSNVDLDNRVITVSKSYNKRKSIFKSTKAGYFRTVPINDSLFEILNALRAIPNPTLLRGDFVFPRIREWGMGLQANELRLFCIEIGIRSVKFHALRACFATHLLSSGTSPAVVMKVAGWRGLDTMQRYTRLAGIYEKGATDCLVFN